MSPSGPSETVPSPLVSCGPNPRGLHRRGGNRSEHPQPLAGGNRFAEAVGYEQMHRDDTDWAAGPRGGEEEVHGREGERPGRNAPPRSQPGKGPEPARDSRQPLPDGPRRGRPSRRSPARPASRPLWGQPFLGGLEKPGSGLPAGPNDPRGSRASRTHTCALGISHQLLAELLNRDPRLLLLLEGGIDRNRFSTRRLCLRGRLRLRPAAGTAESRRAPPLSAG